MTEPKLLTKYKLFIERTIIMSKTSFWDRPCLPPAWKNWNAFIPYNLQSEII